MFHSKQIRYKVEPGLDSYEPRTFLFELLPSSVPTGCVAVGTEGKTVTLPKRERKADNHDPQGITSRRKDSLRATVSFDQMFRDILAISDYRGKKAEIYQTISLLPLFEWQVLEKKYPDYGPTMITPLSVAYKRGDRKIYLSATKWSESDKKMLR